MSVDNWVTIFLTVIAWFISYFASIKIFNYSKEKELKEKEDENKRVQIKFLKGIKAELFAIYERFNLTTERRHHMIKEYGYFNFHYRVDQSYFTFYENACHVIGEINDEELLSSIVSLYVNLKGTIETFNINNELLIKYENYIIEAKREPTCTVSTRLEQIYLEHLQANTQQVKSAFSVIENDLPKVITKIDQYICNE